MRLIDWIIGANIQTLIDQYGKDLAKMYQLAVIRFDDITDTQPNFTNCTIDQDMIPFIRSQFSSDFRPYTACHLTAEGLVQLFGNPSTERSVKGQLGSADATRALAIAEARAFLSTPNVAGIISVTGRGIADGHSFCLLKDLDGTVTTLEAWSTPTNTDGRTFLWNYYQRLKDPTRSDYPTRTIRQTMDALQDLLSVDIDTRTRGYTTLSCAYSSASRYEMRNVPGGEAPDLSTNNHLINITIRACRPEVQVRNIIRARLLFLCSFGLSGHVTPDICARALDGGSLSDALLAASLSSLSISSPSMPSPSMSSPSMSSPSMMPPPVQSPLIPLISGISLADFSNTLKSNILTVSRFLDSNLGSIAERGQCPICLAAGKIKIYQCALCGRQGCSKCLNLRPIAMPNRSSSTPRYCCIKQDILNECYRMCTTVGGR